MIMEFSQKIIHKGANAENPFEINLMRCTYIASSISLPYAC